MTNAPTLLRSLPPSLLAAGLLLVALGGLGSLSACDDAKDAVDEVVEKNLGCSKSDLGHLDEPDLPNCSALVACCKFLQGECGKIQVITPPQEVLDACAANEEFVGTAIEQYQAIDGETCPELLSEDACEDGVESTKEKYRASVDGGDGESLAEGAPNCSTAVQETLVPLAEQLGDSADLLPDACSVP